MKNIGAKELSEVSLDLAGEVRSVIVHREKNALNLQWLIEGLSDPFDGVHELGNPLKGEELALDRDEDGV